MEAAGLYAFARGRRRDVLCLAHVTNRLGQPGDFGKGVAEGAAEACALIGRFAAAWRDGRTTVRWDPEDPVLQRPSTRSTRREIP